MVPHYSGTTLDAQLRYAQGAKSILENYLDGKPQDPANLIVENGAYATKNCKSHVFVQRCIHADRICVCRRNEEVKGTCKLLNIGHIFVSFAVN